MFLFENEDMAVILDFQKWPPSIISYFRLYLNNQTLYDVNVDVYTYIFQDGEPNGIVSRAIARICDNFKEIKQKSCIITYHQALQIASLIALINLVDIQTQSKAYLSMEDIETTKINMLGGEDVLATHFLIFTRQWLKEGILSELPSTTSARKKNMRKPIIYSPKACEKDIVRATLREDNGLDDIKIIYKAAQLVRRSITNFPKTEVPADAIPNGLCCRGTANRD
jgi:hypothetical protein